MAKNHALAALFLLILIFLLVFLSCGDDDENAWKRKLQQDLQTTEARLDEVRDTLTEEQTKAREDAQDMTRQLEGERARTESAEEDFLVAAVMCFSCVLTVFLLLNLLAKEHRSKRVLVRFLRYLHKGDRSN